MTTSPRRRAAMIGITLAGLLLTGALVLPWSRTVEPTCLGEAATIVGTDDPDVLDGTPGSDVIVGQDGDDVVNGQGGADLLCGGAGADSIVGSTGADTLVGDAGSDALNGGIGDDALRGGVGTDTCLQGPETGGYSGCERFDLQPAFPIRATFYWSSYPEAWMQEGVHPFTNHHPSLGYYHSEDASVIRAHLEAMRYAGIQAGISSWWGQGDVTDRRLAGLLRAATDSDFRWTLHYEPEAHGDPSADRIRSDLTYIQSRYGSDQSFLRVDGRFVVFVNASDDTDCGVVRRWQRANTVGAYVVLKVFYGYLGCRVQPDGWYQIGPAVAENDQGPFSFSISPGYWRVGEDPRLARDPARWVENITNMMRSGAQWQLVTEFNGWGAGTSVESAEEWASASGFGIYLDALHDVTWTPNPLPNITLGKSAMASMSLSDSPPWRAVDGGTGTLWNSGDYAPQWIEIDLGGARPIGQISLLIAQLPEGETVHRVLGKARPDDPFRLLHEFAGSTADGQRLEYAPPAPWENVRFLRIETTQSPSWVAWREIEVYPAG